MMATIEKEQVVRIPVVLFGQFEKDYLKETIHQEILEGQFIPIPDDTPIRPADYVELSRYGFAKKTVFVCSLLMLIFGLVEFIANGLLLHYNSAIMYVGVGFICAVLLATAGSLGIAASRTLEDCPIATTMVLVTLTSLTCFGQFGIATVGLLSDFLGSTMFGASAVTNPTLALVMHACNGIASIVGCCCSITVAAMTFRATCCTSKRFEYRALMLYKMKQKNPTLSEDFDDKTLFDDQASEKDSHEFRSSLPSKRKVLAEDKPPRRDILDFILGGYKTQKVSPW